MHGACLQEAKLCSHLVFLFFCSYLLGSGVAVAFGRDRLKLVHLGYARNPVDMVS